MFLALFSYFSCLLVSSLICYFAYLQNKIVYFLSEVHLLAVTFSFWIIVSLIFSCQNMQLNSVAGQKKNSKTFLFYFKDSIVIYLLIFLCRLLKRKIWRLMMTMMRQKTSRRKVT